MPLYRQLVTQIVEAIKTGQLAAGSRLPPTRQLAQERGLARQTVLAAYQELIAEGWAEGQVGRGTYVVGRVT